MGNDLGNIWDTTTPGNGLVHFDVSSGAFNRQTITHGPEQGLHCRSSAQDVTDPTTVYLLTQEPNPEPSKLVVLKQNDAAVTYMIARTICLPARDGGADSDGGADVISLGRNQVLVTDRFGSGENGKMYLYDISGDDSAPKQTWTLGDYPRQTGIVGTGTVASASMHQDMVTYFPGLLQKDGNGYTIQPDASSIQSETVPGPKKI